MERPASYKDKGAVIIRCPNYCKLCILKFKLSMFLRMKVTS